MADIEEPRWAEDVNGLWHERSDNFWDNDITADVRAHTLCGKDIWSCHVSNFDPRKYHWAEREPYCHGCNDVSAER